MGSLGSPLHNISRYGVRGISTDCSLPLIYTTHMNETKVKGLTTELQCQLFFTQLGYNVSIPLGEDCKYDLIVDIKGDLYRIQVKTCHAEENGIEFRTKSSYLTSQGTVSSEYTDKDIDFFATFYNNQCYLIPVNQCGKTSKKLLFKKQTGVAFIEDYEALKIIDLLDKEEKMPNGGEYKIMQYDLNGNFIQSFSSYIEAAKSLGKTQSAHIGQCVRGERKSAYGFMWKKE